MPDHAKRAKKSCFNIRSMTAADAGDAAMLESECFSEPWSKKGFLDALKNKDNIFLVSESEGRLAGYCGMYCAGDEGEITNVAVRGDLRGKGAALGLLERLTELSEQKGIRSIFLEVRQSNQAAIGLYKKAGFEMAGIRKHFYRKPDEDAVTMCLRII